jgi:hypothetical protein
MPQSLSLAAVAEDLALATAAGYVGTKAMEPVSMKLYQLQDEQARKQEDEARPGPPYEIAATKIAALLGARLEGTNLYRASMAMHYGLAIGWAPVYALLRRRGGMSPLGAALAGGASMSLLVDEGLTPALGFSAPNRAYPLVTHLRGFTAHLVFGLAVAAVYELAWAARGRRP